MRLKELAIKLPRNLTFVPIDFEKQKLTDELQLAGCRLDIPVFVSLLGVAHYLTEEAVFQTLSDVANMSPGSEIIFDYLLVDSLVDKQDRRGMAWGHSRKSQQPMLSQFDPLILAEHLKEMGFAEVWDFGPEDANAIYFAGRIDGLSPSALNQLSYSVLRTAHFMKARV